MPRVDELIKRLGPVRYITTIDFTKGYWQIHSLKRCRKKLLFPCQMAIFSMRFSLVAYMVPQPQFHRLIDLILQPHTEYAAAYLDVAVIFSTDWESHLAQAVLDSFSESGLTANPINVQ